MSQTTEATVEDFASRIQYAVEQKWRLVTFCVNSDGEYDALETAANESGVVDDMKPLAYNLTGYTSEARSTREIKLTLVAYRYQLSLKLKKTQ